MRVPAPAKPASPAAPAATPRTQVELPTPGGAASVAANRPPDSGLPPSTQGPSKLPPAAGRAASAVPRAGDSGALRPIGAAEAEPGSKVAADRRPGATARGSGARCAELTQRLQLGEALSPEHLEVFQKECKR